MSSTITSSQKFTFLFAPLNAWGHINACIGIASELKTKFGHRIIFVINTCWRGRLIKLGFEEEVYVDEIVGATPSQDWTNLVAKIGLAMRLSSLEKIGVFGLPAQERMVAEIMRSNSEIGEIISRAAPDCIVVDNYVLAPAIIASEIPWVRLRSANPLEINPVLVPPQNSGYSAENGDAVEWAHFTETQNKVYKILWDTFSSWFLKNCEASLPVNAFISDSTHLNLYLYPQELDYIDRRPMPDKWVQIDALVKPGERTFRFPPKLEKYCGGKIIYLSLGTFGSADLFLMTRIVELLSRTCYTVIVSKGPLHKSYELPMNMWGAESLPQTEVLPLVDGVICHGGNSTLNECFYFGKPMIILPILGDEYDNAQRVSEKGYGIRQDPYSVTFEELCKSLSFILEDPILTRKVKEASARIRNSKGPAKAADLILSILQ